MAQKYNLSPTSSINYIFIEIIQRREKPTHNQPVTNKLHKRIDTPEKKRQDKNWKKRKCGTDATLNIRRRFHTHRM